MVNPLSLVVNLINEITVLINAAVQAGDDRFLLKTEATQPLSAAPPVCNLSSVKGARKRVIETILSILRTSGQGIKATDTGAYVTLGKYSLPKFLF